MEQEQVDAIIEAVSARLSPAGPQTGRQGLRPSSGEEEEASWLPPKPLPQAAGVARYIDHTQLKAHAGRAEIEALCAEAREHDFWSVCVNASNVRLATASLRGSRTRVCTVVGFPLGATTPATKAFEAREAARSGASEIDMVLNVGALKSRDFNLVAEDIRAVVEAVPGKLVKVILECAALEDREKILACALAKGAGAHFVKTSTGFGGGGATLEDVRLMREVVGRDMGVKASGGVRDLEAALAMLEAGASRLGCSSSVAIVRGEAGESTY